jgi:hypothetical protein
MALFSEPRSKKQLEFHDGRLFNLSWLFVIGFRVLSSDGELCDFVTGP